MNTVESCLTLSGFHSKHTLPYTRQITKIEYVMEFGRSGQHLNLGERKRKNITVCNRLLAPIQWSYLCPLPKNSCSRNKQRNHSENSVQESTFCAKISVPNNTWKQTIWFLYTSVPYRKRLARNALKINQKCEASYSIQSLKQWQKCLVLTKYLINGSIWRQRTVEYAEHPFESLRYVVPSTAGMNHGSNELHVHDVGEISRLLQRIHPSHLHHLTHDLVGNLQT